MPVADWPPGTKNAPELLTNTTTEVAVTGFPINATDTVPLPAVALSMDILVLGTLALGVPEAEAEGASEAEAAPAAG